MQKVITTALLFLNLYSYGQKESWESFKLLIIKPDTAIIDKSLLNEIDSIEIAHLKSEYECLNINKKLENDTILKYWKQTNILVKNPSTSSLPDYIWQFKFFHIISEYSRQIYEFKFNQYVPNSVFIELPDQPIDINSLTHLSDSTGADYIVFFKNIHTVIKNNLPILKLTTSLYSKEEKRVILKKKTEGNTVNTGTMTSIDKSNVMWTCDEKIKLHCMLINAVRTSTYEIFEMIRRRQVKQ